MNMDALRQYIQQVLTEVRRDDKFIAQLQRRRAPTSSGRQVAGEWLSGLEMELGHRITREQQKQVMTFVKSRWDGLVRRYGDEGTARGVLLQLLDNKFSTLRMG